MSKYLLVILGLEGTGHHGICHVLSGKVKHSFQIESQVKSLIAADELTFGKHSNKLMEQLRMLPNASTTMFQCSRKFSSISGFKMSFPDQSLSQRLPKIEGKVTTHLNVPYLQTLCDRSNVTLLAVHLKRKIYEAVISSTRFNNFVSQARMLRLNALALHAMLPRLRNRFDVRYDHFEIDMHQLSPYIDLRLLNMSLFRTSHHELTATQRQYIDTLFFDIAHDGYM